MGEKIENGTIQIGEIIGKTLDGRDIYKFTELGMVENVKIIAPQYKDGDFVVNEFDSILILKETRDGFVFDHAYLPAYGELVIDKVAGYGGIKRHATTEEKQRMIEALAERGKRWNAEKKCIEDMPKRKFKKGDKVRIKDGVSSKTHNNIRPMFLGEMDYLIGKTMTVSRYTDESGYVVCNGSGWCFQEDWLEPYVEDIPKHKFKKGDKVVLKSGYKKSDGLIYLDVFDLLIGRKITVAGYTDVGNVCFSDCPYIFEEEWIEPYVEELKEGDLAIFWDNNKEGAFIGKYNGVLVNKKHFPHQDNRGLIWANAIKFESKEQFEKLIKGEI